MNGGCNPDPVFERDCARLRVVEQAKILEAKRIALEHAQMLYREAQENLTAELENLSRWEAKAKQLK